MCSLRSRLQTSQQREFYLNLTQIKWAVKRYWLLLKKNFFLKLRRRRNRFRCLWIVPEEMRDLCDSRKTISISLWIRSVLASIQNFSEVETANALLISHFWHRWELTTSKHRWENVQREQLFAIRLWSFGWRQSNIKNLRWNATKC